MDLGTFNNDGFDRGASRAKELLWLILSALLVAGPIPGSRWRAKLLTAFGAQIGPGVVFKPGVRIKFPWRLDIGAQSWIGERVWIDNLADVRIGANVCISQDAYLGTGNHDWTSPGFDLLTAGITIEEQSWVGARASVAPGTYIEAGAVLGMGALGRGRLRGWTIYAAGAPVEVAPRREKPREGGR